MLNLTGLCILIVEDHEDSRDITRHQAESLGASVVVASDGEQGLEVARRSKPDLIICDLMMPRVDGFEFIRRLRADPTIAHIRVIALTALDKQEDMLRTWRAGFIGHLVKPLHPAMMETQLARVFWHRP
jgi:CheY-like chemotaxis protein